VCLGLVLKQNLGDNIKTQIGVDDRVANRIAAEVEIEILRPFEPELIIARQQKEDLDKKISGAGKSSAPLAEKIVATEAPAKAAKQEFEPKDISEHSNVAAIKNFYNSGNSTQDNNPQANAVAPEKGNVNFDWDNFGKKKEVVEVGKPETSNPQPGTSLSVDEKIDKLTDTINKLVVDRFGGEKKDDGVSEQMKELMRRLEETEKENRENKKLIQKLQGGNQLNNLQNSIKIDKPRSVDIDKTKTPQAVGEGISGNVKIAATTQNIIPVNSASANSTKTDVLDLLSQKPLDLYAVSDKNLTSSTTTPSTNLYSSVVSQSTADAIVETRNKENQATPVTTSAKKVLSLDELLKKNDDKIKVADRNTAQIVFPTINMDKKIDIKNVTQTDGLRQTLLEDIEFLKKRSEPGLGRLNDSADSRAQNLQATPQPVTQTNSTSDSDDTDKDSNNNSDVANLTSAQTSPTLGQFKDELIPKTKEDRMRALQDKIKAMNKGVSSGGANSIAASSLDPYKL
jgi:hypothetical protein